MRTLLALSCVLALEAASWAQTPASPETSSRSATSQQTPLNRVQLEGAQALRGAAQDGSQTLRAEQPPVLSPDGEATSPATPEPTVQSPSSSYNLNDLDPLFDDEPLDLDASAQSFDFSDNNDFQVSQSQDLQSSIASNSNFRGASPQMMGDFGGGSTLFTIGGFPFSNSLSMPIPLAGGGRRIKIAENNQVLPLNRFYTTFNYFHNTSKIVGTVDEGMLGAASQVDSASVIQYTFGFERTFLDDLFSVDVRMPFTGGVDQFSFNPGTVNTPDATDVFADTGVVGDLSVTLKAYLLQAGKTSVSGGLSISSPTGSNVLIDTAEGPDVDIIEIGNDALHLMPFVGLYRPIAETFWFQGFTQVDVPTNGNEVATNGVFRGYLTEQTLLYADISLGKWLYRNPCNSRARGGRGITGIASVFELHYTTSLNDADAMDVSDFTGSAALGYAGPGFENRFDVLNMTLGLQTEFGERWRASVAGVLPLRDGRFEDFVGRREDQLFDGELILQLNRFY